MKLHLNVLDSNLHFFPTFLDVNEGTLVTFFKNMGLSGNGDSKISAGMYFLI